MEELQTEQEMLLMCFTLSLELLVNFFEESFQQVQGLSLTGYPNLAPIDPSYALCHSTLKRMGLMH